MRDSSSMKPLWKAHTDMLYLISKKIVLPSHTHHYATIVLIHKKTLYLLIGERTATATKRISTQYRWLAELLRFYCLKITIRNRAALKTESSCVRNTQAIKHPVNSCASTYVKNRGFVLSEASHFRDFLKKMNCKAKCYSLSKIKELLFLFDLVSLFPRINAQRRQKTYNAWN